MEGVITKMLKNSMKLARRGSVEQASLFQRYSTKSAIHKTANAHNWHPYRKIHPWNSLDEFSQSLVEGVVHAQNGLVAINKPYGISGKDPMIKNQPSSGIPNEVKYTVTDALPYIAKALGYGSLELINTPEKFMSGVAILSADPRVTRAVKKSLAAAQGMRFVPKTFWTVTTKVPSDIKGEQRLAIKMKQGPDGRNKQPIILTTWSENERKRMDVKILNVQYKVISNSTENLSSLLEIKASTMRWHAIRLFAATVLYSPILGDNRFGSRLTNVMGKWVNVSPFVEAARVPPKLDKTLLQLLRISPTKQSIIPAHIHLREIFLPKYKSKEKDVILTAPPMPEFTWTCKKLQFKHELFQQHEDEDSDHVSDDEEDENEENVNVKEELAHIATT